MVKGTKIKTHPEECLCKLFVHTSRLSAYPNSSHMNDLCAICKPRRNQHENQKIKIEKFPYI